MLATMRLEAEGDPTIDAPTADQIPACLRRLQTLEASYAILGAGAQQLNAGRAWGRWDLGAGVPGWLTRAPFSSAKRTVDYAPTEARHFVVDIPYTPMMADYFL